MNVEKYFSTIDTHVAGEAFRIVINSSIKFFTEDVAEAAEILKNGFAHEKNLLLNEPRGHRGMHGCLVLPTSLADIRVLFFQHKADNSFKYEGLLAVITALIETGTIERKEDDTYTIETVYGIYTIKTTVENGEVTGASVIIGQSEKIKEDETAVTIQVEGSRDYVVYSLPASIPAIELQYLALIQSWGLEKTKTLTDANLSFEGVILVEKNGADDKVRSITFEKDGYILRSPGIDASCALLAARNYQGTLINESIFGSYLKISELGGDEKKFCIETEAFVTGTHDFMLDEDDPLKEGFLLA